MLSLSYWPVNPCFPPQEGGKMEGVLFNLMVEGRLQGTLVPLVSRAMPPPPGWSVPCWQCEPIPSLYNLWSSLFLWIWSEPVFSPFPRGFIALGLCWLCGTPPPKVKLSLPLLGAYPQLSPMSVVTCYQKLHRCPLTASHPSSTTQEPRVTQESPTLGLLPLTLWSAPACQVAFMSVLSIASKSLNDRDSVFSFYQ